MRIASITNAIKSVSNNLGSKIVNSPKLLKKYNPMEMNRVNFPPNVFFGLMIGAVLIPRLAQAKKRDNGTGDEIREIFTRDIISMLTLTFAMKGLEGGIADFLSKKKGLVLLTKPTEGMNTFQKIASFMKPKGIKALDKDQLKSKYFGFDNNELFKKFVNYINDEGGDLKKVLTFDKNKKNGVLNALTEKTFGKGEAFDNLSIDKIIKTLSKDDVAESYRAILNNKDTNPLFKYAKTLNAGMWFASLAIVTLFLGIGLPKFNEMITNNKYKSKGGELKPEYENPNSMPLYSGNIRAISKAERQVFSAFLGYKA